MRILALDYGRVRCGCAISDPTGTLVRPLRAVDHPDTPEGLRELALMVAGEQPVEVLVGLPLLESGEQGSQALAARAFAGRLGALIAVPVRLYDERFTTRMARSSVAAGAAADLDSLAAAHLLESYLAASAGMRGGDQR